MNHTQTNEPARAVKVQVRLEGAHLKVRVWIGQENAPGLCGELTMRAEDWNDFYHLLRYGDYSMGPAASIAYDDPAWALINGGAA